MSVLEARSTDLQDFGFNPVNPVNPVYLKIYTNVPATTAGHCRCRGRRSTWNSCSEPTLKAAMEPG